MLYLGISLLCWSALTLVWSPNLYDGLDVLIKLVILAQVLVLGSYLNTLKYIFIGLGLGLAVSSFLVMYGVDGGLFVNPNIMSETAVIIGVGLWIYKSYWLLPLLLPSIGWNALTNPNKYSTRAALLTLAIMILIQIYSKSKIIANLLLGFIGCLGIMVYANYKLAPLNERLVLWTDTIRGLKWFGNGLGSYYHIYPTLTKDLDVLIQRPDYAHNDILQIIFELGIGGLIVILLLALFVYLAEKPIKYVILAFFIVSCFSFPLYMPVTAFIFALTIGHLTRDRYRLQL